MTNNTKTATVIGLGAMGSVLAALLLKNGYQVTVWNRSADKAAALVQQGATLAQDVASAVAASSVIIVCVADYATTEQLLDQPEVRQALKNKTLVQLSTGTPEAGRKAAAWAAGHGIHYLDGAILATPPQMGRPDTTIFLSGNAAAYTQSEAVLKALGGNLLLMGDDAGVASAWDFALLSTLFGAITGFLHGMRISQAERIPEAAFNHLVSQMWPALGEMIRDSGDKIVAKDHSQPQSSVKTCAAGADMLIAHARETGIDTHFPGLLQTLFKKAMDAGFSDEQVSAVIKVM